MYLDLLRIVSLDAYLSADLWPALYSTNTSRAYNNYIDNLTDNTSVVKIIGCV